MNARQARHVLTGTRIRERRLSLSLRQADVARAAGISPAYLNLIEHNHRPAGEALVDRLADVLGVPSEELAEGREEARIAALREAAADAAKTRTGPAPELDQAAEFLARFPGWAGALIANARRAESLAGQLVDLSDRMTQDPYLLTTLHEVLSAVTSLRSTASILSEGGEIPDDWRMRFHENLNQDSLRLSNTAQALVRYLDSFETEGSVYSPQEEVEAWMASGLAPIAEAAELASDAAKSLAAQHLARFREDADLLGDADLRVAAAMTRDPVALAHALSVPLDLVMRRLAILRPAGFERAGLLICDGSGSLILRHATDGFPLPRPADSCPLWPLFQALGQPHTALSHQVVTPEGRRFDTISMAMRTQRRSIGGPVLTLAQMLILPFDPERSAMREDALPIGPACRICPRDECDARREPSILAPLPS
ncbi:short-chain fatty acyl-CoA regulator family protein [Paracoccus sp. Z330]|uniref:Short-chain fatty acyl-CoA regulator family protein n=1 Tax=Paracoccus onchidii TaxID=3017813 RepID=A0ABT4ZJF2_9RHOB|nr:short-chain fatty acyl-CoA regulator family protein [Paracoccus onchidii]MDB6179466.1 short-chain fatty acyl-CoA regulator family protein [Paracoccus onchidii]